MNIVIKGSFSRDVLNKGKEIRVVINSKISQIENAKDTSQITGMIVLEGFTHHYRIKIDYKKKQYRIIAMVRKNTIYLLRFIQRRIVYKKSF